MSLKHVILPKYSIFSRFLLLVKRDEEMSVHLWVVVDGATHISFSLVSDS